MNEIWKEIKGYEKYYEVSNYGRVRSLDRYVLRSDGVVQYRKGKIKSQTLNGDGYYTVNLSKDGINRRIAVHALVGKSFVDGYSDGYEINHIDCNRTNNYYANLEWVTHSDNIQHSIKMGRHVSLTKDFSKEKNPNYGNHKLSLRYAEDKNYSKTKQSRQGKINGRATPIKINNINGKEIKFDYIGQCAEYLISNSISRSKNVNSVRTAITNAIKENRTYQGLEISLL